MKKHTGKVLSLVLALAMVVSSLSSTFVSAATTNTAKGTFSADFTAAKSSVVLANTGTADYTLPIATDLVATFTDLSGNVIANDATKDGIALSAATATHIQDVKIKDWAKSGSTATAATTANAGGTYQVKPVASTTGATVYTATVTANVVLDKNTMYAVTGTATFTVNVVAAGSAVVGKETAATLGEGVAPTAVPSLAINEVAGKAAMYTAVCGTPLVKSTVVYTLDADAVPVSSNAAVFTVVNALGVATLTSATLGSGYIAFTDAAAKTSASALVKVVNTYNAADGAIIAPVFADTKALIAGTDVTGYDINAAGAITLTNGTVNSITAVGDVTINGGTVGTVVSTTGKVTVAGGTVGAITAKSSVLVTKGTVKSITSEAGVVINGGTVNGNVAGTTVDVIATAAATPVVVAGNVSGTIVTIDATYGAGTAAENAAVTTTVTGTAKGSTSVTVGSATTKAAVKVAGVLSKAITIASDKAAVSTVAPSKVIDFLNNVPEDSTLTVNAFNGTLSTIAGFATVDVAAGTLAVGSKLTVKTLTLAANTTITVPEAYIGTIAGIATATVKVPAGKLTVSTAITGTPILSATGTVAVGTTIFTSIAGKAGAFTIPGIVVEQKDGANNTYIYNVKTITLQGLAISNDTLSIGKGYTKTLSVTTNPTSAALPTGYTVKWSVPSTDDYVSVTGTGTTATVTAKNFAEANTALNTVVVTGEIIDQYGLPTSYGKVTCTVTTTAAPAITAAFDKTAASVRVYTQTALGHGDDNSVSLAKLTVTGDTTTLPTVATSDATVATATIAKTATAGVYNVVVKGAKIGTATVTATVGTVTTAPIAVTVTKGAAGYAQIDTANYTMAPKGIYDISFATVGIPTVGSKTVTVTDSRDTIATVTKLANGNYRVTGVRAGTTYVSFAIGNTHASVRIDVVAGSKGGTAVRTASFFD